MTNTPTQHSSHNDNRNWLAAYVKIHHEKKVRDRLLAQDIQCFLPIHTEVRQWSDRKKKVDRIVIPMMIFVHVDVHEQLQVLQTPSVLRYMVLRGERTPAIIPNSQMEKFRFVVERSDAAVGIESNCNLQAGEEVRVTQGPLAGLIGQFVTIKGKSSIAIRIDSIGCAMVEMDAGCVEKV